MNKPRLIISSAYAAILTIIFVVVLTIWAELAPPLKDWLKAFSGHHWTSKSIFSALLYFVATAALYPVFSKSSGSQLRRSLSLTIIAVILGTLTLTGFFTGHHLGLF